MKISIVVPNWNGASLLAECLQSLEAQSIKTEIILVDNGSSDNSVEITEKLFPKVVLIKNRNNLGFAGGVNMGIREALKSDCDFIALFNNDAVAKPDWLEKLLNVMERYPKAGIVTGKFMRDDKIHFDSTGDYYTTRGIAFPRGRNRKDTGQYNDFEKVFGATGGASLYRAELFEEIGFFDERFFAYLEDVDFSFRTQLAGWNIYYEPLAVSYHRLGATSSKLGNFAYYHSAKNFYYLYLKNMPAGLIFRHFHSFIYQIARSFVSSIVNFRFGTYLRAVFTVAFHLPGILRDRHRIQKNRKISSKKIEQYLHIGRPPISPEI